MAGSVITGYVDASSYNITHYVYLILSMSCITNNKNVKNRKVLKIVSKPQGIKYISASSPSVFVIPGQFSQQLYERSSAKRM